MAQSPWMTSVNLDEETKAISEKLSNRSEFIRECLRRWNAAQSQTHLHPRRDTPRCFPLSKKGVCALCWPNGPLDREGYLYYQRMSKAGHNVEGWADERVAQLKTGIVSRLGDDDSEFVSGRNQTTNEAYDNWEIPKDFGKSPSTPRVKPHRASFWKRILVKLRLIR